MTQQEVKEKCLRKRIECLEQREKEYEHQLAEKDKEIEELRKESEDYVIIERNFYNNLQEQLTEMKQIKEMLKQSRHQVCEEIREKLDTVYGEKQFGLVYLENIKIMLDQIENK